MKCSLAIAVFLVSFATTVGGANVVRGDASKGNPTRGASSRQFRENSGDVLRTLKEMKDKDKDGSKDDEDSCFDTDLIFRTCNNRRRRRGRALTRALKKDEDDGPPEISNGFNLEIGTLLLDIGADFETVLNDGCDCREDIEAVILDFLEENFSNELYNFLCVAIMATADTGSETRLTLDLTFEVEDDFEVSFESTDPCSVENLVLCCLAAEIPGAMNPQVDCTTCGLSSCAGPQDDDDFTQFLNNEVDDCEDVAFSALAAPVTDAPTLAPVAQVSDTAAPTIAPVAPVIDTAAPTSSPVVTPVETDAPTAAPVPQVIDTAAPTVAPVVATADTAAPTIAPVVDTAAPSFFPTFTDTMMETEASLSLSVSL